MQYARVWYVFPQIQRNTLNICSPWTTKGSSLKALLRTLENNTELYRGIHYYMQSLNRDCSGLQKEVDSKDYSGLQRVIQNYTEGYTIIYTIYSLTWDYNGLHKGHVIYLLQNNSILKARGGAKTCPPLAKFLRTRLVSMDLNQTHQIQILYHLKYRLYRNNISLKLKSLTIILQLSY